MKYIDSVKQYNIRINILNFQFTYYPNKNKICERCSETLINVGDLKASNSLSRKYKSRKSVENAEEIFRDVINHIKTFNIPIGEKWRSIIKATDRGTQLNKNSRISEIT